MTQTKYNSWTLLGGVESRTFPSGKTAPFAEVRCECGTVRWVRLSCLVNGRSKSCGHPRLKWHTDKGYIAFVLPIGHPLRGVMGKKNGEILEHRFIMAEALGRPLERWETVHHKDGVRDHNELCNLQLRQGKHGAGILMVCNACGSHDVSPAPLAEED